MLAVCVSLGPDGGAIPSRTLGAVQGIVGLNNDIFHSFAVIGVRRDYYTSADGREDAMVMKLLL